MRKLLESELDLGVGWRAGRSSVAWGKMKTGKERKRWKEEKSCAIGARARQGRHPRVGYDDDC